MSRHSDFHYHQTMNVHLSAIVVLYAIIILKNSPLMSPCRGMQGHWKGGGGGGGAKGQHDTPVSMLYKGTVKKMKRV